MLVPESKASRLLPEPTSDHQQNLYADYHRQLCRCEMELTASQAKTDALRFRALELESSLSRYAKLFEEAPVGLLVHDSAGEVRECNRQLLEMLGYRRTTWPGGPLTPLVQRESLPAYLEHLRTVRTSFQQVVTEIELRNAIGGSLPVELITTTYPQTGGKSRPLYQTAVVSLSRRQAVQKVLTKTEQDFETLVDTVQAVVWEADARTLDVLWVSRSGQDLLGYRTPQWYETGFWENRLHVDDRDMVCNNLARLAEVGTPMTLEFRMVAADRRVLWIHSTISPRLAHGAVRLFGVGVDITARKEAEEKLKLAHEELQLRVAEQTAELRATVTELEAFSYSISHDMRAPLRAIQGYAHLVLGRFGNEMGELGQDYLRRMMNSAERLDKLIQDVLHYSRVSRTPLVLQPINLEKTIEEVLTEHRQLQAPDSEIKVAKPLLPVLGNDIFLTQCISNLVSNGMKFVAPGRSPKLRIWTESAGSQVRIFFEDNGIGISNEDQARIFRIFERIHPANEYEGTGIGLAIVRKAVERMGGSVGVESVPGQGSKFWLQLHRA
jgi:PAS domain S-box-containing protein